MRIVRTLLLVALATLALVTTASAESTEVHVEREVTPTHEPCDPCFIHAALEEELEVESALTHAGIIGQCLTEFEGEVGEDGEGHVQVTELTQGPSVNCNFEDCPSAEREWPIQIREVESEERMSLRICFIFGLPYHCDLELHIYDVGTHDWLIRADNAACTNGIPLAFTGEWHLEHEIHDNLEIDHLRD